METTTLENLVVWMVALVLLSQVVGGQNQNQTEDYYDYVSTFIGTGGQGYGIGSVPPGAQAPQGMARVSPDTSTYDNVALEWMHYSGYWYNDSHIRAFSHTHLVGAGVRDLGTLGVMPLNFVPVDRPIWPEDGTFYSRFSHDGEIGKPGYYSVLLTDWNVTAELTATPHVGLHRYTWHDQAGQSVVVVDLCHTVATFGCEYGQVTVDAEAGIIFGSMITTGSFSGRGLHSYFYATSSSPLSFGTWDNYNSEYNRTSASGTTAVGAFFNFGPTSQVSQAELKFGISFISIDQAKLNLELEAGDLDFDGVLSLTQTSWRSILNNFQTAGASETEKVIFYSSLYRVYMVPTNWSEAGGAYLGFDNQVHYLENGTEAFYTDLSIWDVHRTQMPWMTFFSPDIMRDIVQSLVQMFVQLDYQGLPRWAFCNWDADCMIGMHADVIIADAILKGIEGIDIPNAWKALNMSLTREQPVGGLTDYSAWVSLGYIPAEGNRAGSCQTVEFAYDAGVVSAVAKLLGYEAEANLFWNMGQNYRNNYDPETAFFCPRYSNGSWDCPRTWIDLTDNRYVEGDAWHWRFFAPHDIEGLISLFGSPGYFVEQLQELFERGEWDPWTILPNPYYWAGNEEDLLSVWLFDWAGRPDLTQEYSRWILANRYTPYPDGLPGNDDYGTMSAWYLWTALGIYPVTGTLNYAIGSPIFNTTVIGRPSGSKLTIQAHNFGSNNIYVEGVSIDGVALSGPVVQHSQIVNAQLIEFWMTDKPATTWST